MILAAFSCVAIKNISLNICQIGENESKLCFVACLKFHYYKYIHAVVSSTQERHKSLLYPLLSLHWLSRCAHPEIN